MSPRDDFQKGADLSFIKGLSAAERSRFFAAYGGLLLKGRVAGSKAVTSGLSKKKGALNGQAIEVFVKRGMLTCETILNKRVAAQLEQACCDGGADAPCLLNTSYTFTAAKVIGAAGSRAGDKQRLKAVRSKDYRMGIKKFRAKKFKEAAKHFEVARTKGQLDIEGHYRLGYAYRKIDRCVKAVPALEHVYEQFEKGKVPGDQMKVARLSNFLLARCYAMTNRPGKAVLILNSYLIEPGKYRAEIERSLKNRDFGWINASKEYREYVDEARTKLRR